MKIVIAALIACSAFSVLAAAGTVHVQDANGAWTASEDKFVRDGWDVYHLTSGDRVEIYDGGGTKEMLKLYHDKRIEMIYNANGGQPNAYRYAYGADGTQSAEKVRGSDAEAVRAAILALIGK